MTPTSLIQPRKESESDAKPKKKRKEDDRTITEREGNPEPTQENLNPPRRRRRRRRRREQTKTTGEKEPIGNPEKQRSLQFIISFARQRDENGGKEMAKEVSFCGHIIALQQTETDNPKTRRRRAVDQTSGASQGKRKEEIRGPSTDEENNLRSEVRRGGLVGVEAPREGSGGAVPGRISFVIRGEVAGESHPAPGMPDAPLRRRRVKEGGGRGIMVMEAEEELGYNPVIGDGGRQPVVPGSHGWGVNLEESERGWDRVEEGGGGGDGDGGSHSKVPDPESINYHSLISKLTN